MFYVHYLNSCTSTAAINPVIQFNGIWFHTTLYKQQCYGHSHKQQPNPPSPCSTPHFPPTCLGLVGVCHGSGLAAVRIHTDTRTQFVPYGYSSDTAGHTACTTQNGLIGLLSYSTHCYSVLFNQFKGQQSLQR